MRKKVFELLKECGTFDLSHIPTYVTVRGFNSPSQPLKINRVRANVPKNDIEFLAEGKNIWISERACISNTAPRLYDGVFYAYEQQNSHYVLD